MECSPTMVAIEQVKGAICGKAADGVSEQIDGASIVTVSGVTSGALEDSYVLMGLMASVRHANKDKNQEEGGHYKKAPKKNYNRFFYFGSFDGATFVVMSESEKTSRTLLSHVNQSRSEGVGALFALCEPTHDSDANLAKD